ncbi:MAG TPA: class I SAM-dependent methyltransferase, partial [Bacteroidia bacterium]|nr:class I SAM-dependent methyltransferase [Bacteroidia bacterium]
MSWFESWFDSPYYHILYQHRDEQEAEAFLDNLLDYLKPDNHSSMLDLGCGKGRHAVYLNEKGYEVTGIDLSEQSIRYCMQFENDKLSFFVHDMRKLFRVNDFDFVFNLFTSFGFFEKESENIAAIKNACLTLKKGGTIVIDYLNSQFVEDHLVKNDIAVFNGITFNITRELQDGYFLKKISFQDKGNNYNFTEKVAALKVSDFEKYLNFSNM